jgi:hypothetical protein
VLDFSNHLAYFGSVKPTRVLIYSNVPLWQSQHTPAIEIAEEFQKLGTEVVYFSCKGDLHSCPASIEKSKESCNKCFTVNIKSLSKLPKDLSHIEYFARKEIPIFPFDSQERFESFMYDNLPAGSLALSQLIDNESDLDISLDKLNSLGLNLIKDAINLYCQTIEILSKYKFDAVYVWNGRRNSDGPVIYAAKKLDIASFVYVSASDPSKYAIYPNSLHSLKDFQVGFNDFFKAHCYSPIELEHAAYLFYQNQKTGGLLKSFDFIQYSKNYSKNYNNYICDSKLHLVLFTSSQWETYNFKDKVFLNKDFKNSYALIHRIISDQEILSKFKITVRWHPNLVNAGPFEKAKVQEIIKNSHLIEHVEPASSCNSYALMNSADIVVTTGSTLGAEATYAGKISILLGVSYYSGLDIAYEPKDYSDFILMLNSEITPKSKHSAVKFGAYFALYGYTYRNYKYLFNEYWHRNDKFKLLSLFANRIRNWVTYQKLRIKLLVDLN